MKKLTILAVAVSITMGLAAQSESDILLTSRIAPTGTARSMALSNAMGAIGGDMTAITFNPAGIGIYRSSDFSFTSGLQLNKTKADYLGNSLSDNNTNFTLSQLGFVSTFKNRTGSEQGIVSSHFSFGYNRVNNFNQDIWLSGVNPSSSMLDMWALQANGYTQEELANSYNTANSALAYRAYLINENPEGSMRYDHPLGLTDENTGQFQFQALNGMNQMQIIEKSGNGGEYSITGGINVSNILLIGGSLNFQNIRSEQVSMYEESVVGGLTPSFPDDLQSFKLYETWNRYGTSTNLKLGVIVKPINAIRLGFAFHSPNWFHMREEYSSQVSSKFLDANYPYTETGIVNEFSYRLNTPMKLIGSFALVSSVGFISVDYEFQDYSTAEFKNYDSDYEYMDYFMGINRDIKTYFTQTHALRIGSELRLENVLLRAGAGLYGSPYKKEYLMDQEPMQQRTYSAGIGYRQQNFYIDAGYMMLTQNEDYYPYNYDANNANNAYLVAGRVPQGAKLKSTTHNAMLTIGFKF
jgi:hypothetical protein